MSTIEPLVQDFLSQKRLAVAGITRTRDEAANLIYRKLRDTGHQVYALNPNTDIFDGAPCYPNLKSLPEPVDGVVIVTRPEVAEQIVQECVELSIPRVWMHCSLGTSPKIGKNLAAKITSASAAAVRLCQENNITVIPGGCPMMFCEPVDFGHKCMRWTLGVMGHLSK
jgi:hypothetical protein